MSLVYKGDVTFQETADSGQLGVDLWGADTLTREYEGSKALLQTFLNSLKITIAGFLQNGQRVVVDRSRQVQDKQFRDLWLTDFSVDPGRAFAKVRCNFKGVYNGRTPQPVTKFGLKAQQITLPFIGDELGITNGISASFTYKAPYSIYRYMTKRKPTKALFKSKIEPLSDALQIASRSGAAGNLVYFKGKSLTSRTVGISSGTITGSLNAYNAVVEVITDVFDCEPVGNWWAVTESNQIILTPLDLAHSGWVYQLG